MENHLNNDDYRESLFEHIYIYGRDLQGYDFWYPNPTRRSLNPPDPTREDF